MTGPTPTYSVKHVAGQVGMGRNQLYRLLREMDVIDAANMPRRHVIDAGYMRWESVAWDHPELGTREHIKPSFTPAGVRWIAGRIKEHRARDTA